MDALKGYGLNRLKARVQALEPRPQLLELVSERLLLSIRPVLTTPLVQRVLQMREDLRVHRALIRFSRNSNGVPQPVWQADVELLGKGSGRRFRHQQQVSLIFQNIGRGCPAPHRKRPRVPPLRARRSQDAARAAPL
jgi:hypothetical protein